MLGIVGDPIDPCGLAYSSLPQYENIDILLRIKYLQIQQKEQITNFILRQNNCNTYPSYSRRTHAQGRNKEKKYKSVQCKSATLRGNLMTEPGNEPGVIVYN